MRKRTKKNESIHRTFRLDVELVERLKQIAQEQNRSVSNVAEMLLMQAIGMAEPPAPLRAKTLDQAA